jgi:hypothetical protein
MGQLYFFYRDSISPEQGKSTALQPARTSPLTFAEGRFRLKEYTGK